MDLLGEMTFKGFSYQKVFKSLPVVIGFENDRKIFAKSFVNANITRFLWKIIISSQKSLLKDKF